jgi:hypothetical protein
MEAQTSTKASILSPAVTNQRSELTGIAARRFLRSLLTGNGRSGIGGVEAVSQYS